MASTETKVAVGIGVGVAIVGAVLLLSAHKDTPIEVADGSMRFVFDKFRKDSDKKITATKPGHKAQTIEVVDATTGVSFINIDVTGREWTIASTDNIVNITKTAPPAGKDEEVPIIAITGNLIRDDDNNYHHDDAGHRFTPATLTLSGFPPSIPLFCPSGTCRIKIHLKK